MMAKWSDTFVLSNTFFMGLMWPWFRATRAWADRARSGPGKSSSASIDTVFFTVAR
jgi:hypothetical protein